MKERKITILFIIIAASILVGIGFTFAYFISNSSFSNLFASAYFKTVATEVFESPSKWDSGETVPKTVTVKNESSIPVNVRISYTEEWISKNGDTLPNKVNGESVAIINLANTDDWTKVGNKYYYNNELAPGETTSSFMESVTLNPNLTASLECIDITEIDGVTKRCKTTGDGYDQGHYTLTIKIETMQADVTEDGWDKKYYSFVSRKNPNTVSLGDEIAIDTEHFYILEYDSYYKSAIAIAKYNLFVGDIFDYDSTTGNFSLYKTLSPSDPGYGLQNSTAKGFVNSNGNARYIGVVPYSGDYCFYDSEYDYNYDNDNHNPLIDYSNGYGIEVSNNSYNLRYYLNKYESILQNYDNRIGINGLLYNDYFIADYEISNKNACESYFSELWTQWGNEFTNEDVIRFCSGGEDIYGEDLSKYISYEYFPSSDYALAGLSNVTIYVPSFLKSTSYWTNNYYDSNSIYVYKDGEYTLGVCEQSNYYGVRPLIYLILD